MYKRIFLIINIVLMVLILSSCNNDEIEILNQQLKDNNVEFEAIKIENDSYKKANLELIKNIDTLNNQLTHTQTIIGKYNTIPNYTNYEYIQFPFAMKVTLEDAIFYNLPSLDSNNPGTYSGEYQVNLIIYDKDKENFWYHIVRKEMPVHFGWINSTNLINNEITHVTPQQENEHIGSLKLGDNIEKAIELYGEYSRVGSVVENTIGYHWTIGLGIAITNDKIVAIWQNTNNIVNSFDLYIGMNTLEAYKNLGNKYENRTDRVWGLYENVFVINKNQEIGVDHSKDHKVVNILLRQPGLFE